MSSQSFVVPPEIFLNTGAMPGNGPIRYGSDEHKRLFCKTLLDTFNPYRPAVIDWPKLDQETQNRITSLPIWDIAVQTENRAGLYVATYAEGITDPLLKKAVELDGHEERRHRHVLSHLVEAYGIKLAPEAPFKRPKDPEWAFMVTGYSECIDSFFAFGLFEAAKNTGYFPPELIDTFEPVIQEEGRHILFFVNWVAWWRRNMPFWRRPWFELKVLGVWAFLIYERMGIASDVSNGQQDNNFTMNGAQQLGADIDIGQLLDVCLKENDRRLGIYDPRLKRPRFVPFMARLARRLIGKPKAAA
ncbi:MAG TPA: ferritin-like domain-containing protein [Rhizomicrobium sp.]|nr:ferritin-like domain-containing protein [Rhizomicrobium sp.]